MTAALIRLAVANLVLCLVAATGGGVWPDIHAFQAAAFCFFAGAAACMLGLIAID